MNPNRLVVPAFLLALSAAPVAAETFQDWALFRAGDVVYGMRAADYDATMTAHVAGAGISHAALYDLAANDVGAADSVMAVAARPIACLRLYPKDQTGVPKAVRLKADEDISATHLQAGSGAPYGSSTAGPGLRMFRGGWDRHIKVTVAGEVPPFCERLISIAKLNPAQQTLAEALRQMDEAGHKAFVAASDSDRLPLLELVSQQYLSHDPGLVNGEDGKPDVLASLHYVDRAAILRLPADQQKALRDKLATAVNPETAKQLIGEIRKAVAAYMSSNGDPGAMATLTAATRRIAAARFNPETGAVIFDGATPAAAVPVVAQQDGPPRAAPLVLTGDPNRLGVVTSPRTDAPPTPPGLPGPGEKGPLSGLLGGAGDLLKSPYVSAGLGMAAGALVGFMIAGPFGAAVGGALGLPLGLMVAQFFGARGES